MNLPDPLFAYFGPETVLPMTSVVATVVGLVLMFGRNTLYLAARCCRLVLGRAKRTSASPKPHFRIVARSQDRASRVEMD